MLKVRPEGSEGLISQVCTFVFDADITMLVIATPLVNSTFVADADRLGRGSLMVILTVVFEEPPELFA